MIHAVALPLCNIVDACVVVLQFTVLHNDLTGFNWSRSGLNLGDLLLVRWLSVLQSLCFLLSSASINLDLGMARRAGT